MKIMKSFNQRLFRMNLNKLLILILNLIFLASCSSNNDFQIINTDNNVKIQELEKIFNRVIGNGVLQGKGRSNFTSSFIFESSDNNSIIVFKDFLGRRQYMIEAKNDSVRYYNVRKKTAVTQKEFDKFFPLSNQLNSNFYKGIIWGDVDALNTINVQYKNTYVISTKMISIDGSNYLNEIVFLMNNEKQNYTIKFYRRNFD